MRQALCGRSQGCPVDEWTAVRLADLGPSTLTPGPLRHQSRVGCRAGASGAFRGLQEEEQPQASVRESGRPRLGPPKRRRPK